MPCGFESHVFRLKGFIGPRVACRVSINRRQGGVAEWLRTGLQTQVYQFNSGRRLWLYQDRASLVYAADDDPLLLANLPPEDAGGNPAARLAPHGVDYPPAFIAWDEEGTREGMPYRASMRCPHGGHANGKRAALKTAKSNDLSVRVRRPPLSQ